jgi:hypothetical protein
VAEIMNLTFISSVAKKKSDAVAGFASGFRLTSRSEITVEQERELGRRSSSQNAQL